MQVEFQSRLILPHMLRQWTVDVKIKKLISLDRVFKTSCDTVQYKKDNPNNFLFSLHLFAIHT